MNGYVNTLRAELFKLRHKRRSYVMAGFLWLLLPALLLLIGWILDTRVAGTFAEEGFSVGEVVQAVASPVAIARNLLLIMGNLSPSLLIIIVALTAALLIGEPVLPTDWTPLILLAIGSQVVGQGLLVYAMGHLTPTVVGLGLLTQPAAAALIGWLVYDERMTPLDGVGALAIGVALVLVRLRPRAAALT